MLAPQHIHRIRSNEAAEACHEDCDTSLLNVVFHLVEKTGVFLADYTWISNENGYWAVLGIGQVVLGAFEGTSALEPIFGQKRLDQVSVERIKQPFICLVFI